MTADQVRENVIGIEFHLEKVEQEIKETETLVQSLDEQLMKAQDKLSVFKKEQELLEKNLHILYDLQALKNG